MPPTRVAFTRRAARAASGATQVMPALIAGGTRDGKGARFTCDTRRSTAVATNTPLSSRGLALRCSHIPVAHFKVVIPAKRATRARAGTHGRGGAPGPAADFSMSVGGISQWRRHGAWPPPRTPLALAHARERQTTWLNSRHQ